MEMRKPGNIETMELKNRLQTILDERNTYNNYHTYPAYKEFQNFPKLSNTSKISTIP